MAALKSFPPDTAPLNCSPGTIARHGLGSRPGHAPGSARTAPTGRALLAHPAVRALPFVPDDRRKKGAA